MQSWDSRQSLVSFTGAVFLALILAVVFLHLRLSYLLPLAVLLAGLLFYYLNMRRYFLRKRWVAERFPEHWREILESSVPFYARKSPEEKLRFEDAVKIFLHENTITGVGCEVDDKIRLLVASSAVILLFGRPDWEYPRLPEILIYPQSFNEEYDFTRRSGDRILAGIVVPQNGIVLSKDGLLRAFSHPNEAYHVGLHEFAHALDLTDGVAEGVPRYLRAGKIKEWYDLIRSELRKVREKRSVLNPYAGTNTAELFAVAVEHFFQRPEELKSEHPRLYDALSSFFNQDPAKM